MTDEATTPAFPEEWPIQPLDRPPHATVAVPGSKSITNRALVLAALADPSQGCELLGALRSEDTEVMIDGLRALGVRVRTDWPASVVHVRGGGAASPIAVNQADIFVANSGTTMRFLTALASLGNGRYRLDGVTRMRERPIEDLLAALRQLGVRADSERGDGYPPVLIKSYGLTGGRARIKGDVSSQFLSGLLMAATRARWDVTVEVDGALVSRPYVDMTVRMIRQFGGRVETDPPMSWFCVPGVQRLACPRYAIEPDATAASYFFAAAAITGGVVTVPGITRPVLQGDVRFVNILREMGCRITEDDTGITVAGRSLRGVEVDMNDISDTVMTLAAVALFAEGPTAIRNVAHIRHKETDRLHALATELRRVGAAVDEFADGLTVTPGPLHGAAIETYNDHRMAMSMALVGLRVPGIVIRNPACVTKTYPHFFNDLERLPGA
jgi:3-phosphoshikimate 1-carboxyvinyltransferase